MLGADVDAACRVKEQQNSALRHQALGNSDLLLVAAREGAGSLVHSARSLTSTVAKACLTAASSAEVRISVIY